MNNLRKFIFFLIILEVFLSIYIIYEDAIGNTAFCILGTNCADVQNSAYGKIFGFKASWLGLVGFSLLFVTYLLTHYKKLPHKLHHNFAIIGGLFAAYFLFIQFFILKQICTTCLLIDSMMILILILSFYELRKQKHITSF